MSRFYGGGGVDSLRRVVIIFIAAALGTFISSLMSFVNLERDKIWEMIRQPEIGLPEVEEKSQGEGSE